MKKMLALVLSIVMVLGMLPMVLSVSAAPTVTFSANWTGGNLTIEWDEATDAAYKAEKVRLNGETELEIAPIVRKVTVEAPDLRPEDKVEVGFTALAVEGETAGETPALEWVSVPKVAFAVKTIVDAYKAGGYIHIKVTDEFGNNVPGGTKLDIALDDGTQSVGLSKFLDDNGTAIADVRNFVNFQTAKISLAAVIGADMTYLAGSTTVDMTVEDKTVQTQMTLSSVDGKIEATVTDEDGVGIEGVSVVLDFGSNAGYKTVTTDADGVAKFGVATAENVKIVCRVGDWTEKHITYKGCTATYAAPTTTTTTTTTTLGTTTTTTEASSTESSATMPTTTTGFGVMTGVGTTGSASGHAGYVSVNAVFDTGVVEAFGLKDADFLNRAQLLIKQEDYDALVQDGAVLYLSVRHSAAVVTMDHIRAAIAEDYDLVSFKDDQISNVSAVLSAQLLSSTGELVSLVLNDSEYIVRLPIPKAMSEASLVAVAQQLGDGISEPIFATVKDGYFEFSTANLAELTFLGFTEEKQEVKNTYVVFTVIFIIIGVLLLVCAGLILYFAVIRKPKQEVEEEMTDLYSDDPEQVVTEDGDIVIAPMDDMGDLPPIQDDFFNDIVMPSTEDEQE